MKRPSEWWARVWKAWAAFGVAFELFALLKGKPLTGVARERLLLRALGSVGMGAFVVWLGYHWLLDTGPGVTWVDIAVAICGGFIGWTGWHGRQNEKARKDFGRRVDDFRS